MFEINVFGADESALTDREKEQLACQIHRFVQEDLDLAIETVDIEGYKE